MDLVVALVAAQRVGTGFAEDQIVASTAFGRVDASAGGDGVVAAAALQPVGAGIADQQIVAVTALKGVGLEAEYG